VGSPAATGFGATSPKNDAEFSANAEIGLTEKAKDK
jgi:hypothetical protein